MRLNMKKTLPLAIGGLAVIVVAALVAKHFHLLGRKAAAHASGAWAGGDIQTIFGKYGSRGAAGGGDIQTFEYPKSSILNVHSLDDYNILKYTLNNVRPTDNSFTTGAYGNGALGTENKTPAMHGEMSYKNHLGNEGPATRVTPPYDILKDRKLIIAGDNCHGQSYYGGITLGYAGAGQPTRGNASPNNLKFKIPLEQAYSYNPYTSDP